MKLFTFLKSPIGAACAVFAAAGLIALTASLIKHGGGKKSENRPDAAKDETSAQEITQGAPQDKDDEAEEKREELEEELSEAPLEETAQGVWDGGAQWVCGTPALEEMMNRIFNIKNGRIEPEKAKLVLYGADGAREAELNDKAALDELRENIAFILQTDDENSEKMIETNALPVVKIELVCSNDMYIVEKYANDCFVVNSFKLARPGEEAVKAFDELIEKIIKE